MLRSNDEMEAINHASSTTTRLRKRRNKSNNHDDKQEVEENSAVVQSRLVNNGENSTCASRQRARKLGLLFKASLLIHAIALSTFISGFIFRGISLHNGDECDMTYSARRFLELDISSFSKDSSKATKLYKLYKFVDQRDPRYQKILKGHQPLTSGYCTGSSNVGIKSRIVLYIPGHWGSFSQSRSVGAHGVQITRAADPGIRNVQQALASNLWTGNALEEDTFVYEVYSVDFSEQGAALHGEFLRLQSDFVASAVQHLAVSKTKRNSVFHVDVLSDGSIHRSFRLRFLTPLCLHVPIFCLY